jgi:hypothetical protein
MRIDALGNVGIGTTAPTRPLHVYSATQTNSGIIIGSSSAKILQLGLEVTSPANWLDNSSPAIMTETTYGNLKIDSGNTSADLYLNSNSTTRNVRIGGNSLVLMPRATADAVQGGIYFDSDTSTFYKCTNGSTWTAF